MKQQVEENIKHILYNREQRTLGQRTCRKYKKYYVVENEEIWNEKQIIGNLDMENKYNLSIPWVKLDYARKK